MGIEWLNQVEVGIFLAIILGWVCIGIQKLRNVLKGRCPKGRICENSDCAIGAWCEKLQRHENAFKNALELIREAEREEKRKKKKK